MPQDRIKLLQDMPVFGGIRTDVLRFLVERAPIVQIPKDAYFFREGETGSAMFVLESGEVAILKNWQDKECLLNHLHRGDCFGEMALIDLFPRSASVLCLKACSAIQLSSEILFEVYEKDLEQFTMIQMNIARELSRRLRDLEQRLFEVNMQAPDAGKRDALQFL